MNNKGYSTGFSWIYGLVSIFGLGLLYIIFDQVLSVYVAPTIKSLVNTTSVPPATVVEVFGHIDKIMDFFHIMPFILFGVVVIFMIVASFRKEGESEFQ